MFRAESTLVTHKTGIAAVAVRIGLVLAFSAALSACGKYGLKGDRGLPPPSETLAYPNMNLAPDGASDRRLRAPEDQARVKADVLARKKQR